jgi:hypothetical protein
MFKFVNGQVQAPRDPRSDPGPACQRSDLSPRSECAGRTTASTAQFPYLRVRAAEAWTIS